MKMWIGALEGTPSSGGQALTSSQVPPAAVIRASSLLRSMAFSYEHRGRMAWRLRENRRPETHRFYHDFYGIFLYFFHKYQSIESGENHPKMESSTIDQPSVAPLGPGFDTHLTPLTPVFGLMTFHCRLYLLMFFVQKTQKIQKTQFQAIDPCVSVWPMLDIDDPYHNTQYIVQMTHVWPSFGPCQIFTSPSHTKGPAVPSLLGDIDPILLQQGSGSRQWGHIWQAVVWRTWCGWVLQI